MTEFAYTVIQCSRWCAGSSKQVIYDDIILADCNQRSTFIYPVKSLPINSPAVINAALEGMGIFYEPDFLVYETIRQKCLVRLLQDWETEEFNLYAVYANRQYMPLQVRSFIDSLVVYFEPVPYLESAQ